jgi:hypothetical protein
MVSQNPTILTYLDIRSTSENSGGTNLIYHSPDYREPISEVVKKGEP